MQKEIKIERGRQLIKRRVKRQQMLGIQHAQLTSHHLNFRVKDREQVATSLLPKETKTQRKTQIIDHD